VRLLVGWFFFVADPVQGGTKQAPKLWKTVVKPLWDEAGVTYDVIETEYAGHAKLLAREINLAHYDALTTISGDGLFWELLNGLFTRPDWSEAVKIPFCVMPGGSGNALASAAGIQDLVRKRTGELSLSHYLNQGNCCFFDCSRTCSSDGHCDSSSEPVSVRVVRLGGLGNRCRCRF
jgi:hypothetical protein